MNSRATINHGAASRRRGNPGARLKPALWRKNGNCTGYTSAGGNVTDTWDAEDRLATVTKGGTLSTFSYDGYSRCIQIVESTSGTVTATKRFVWDGATRCEERNANNNVIERFFPEGEQISGVNYFYTHDRLGSVREVTSASGSILADYAYDAFGNQTLLDGTPIGDVGYAGYFYHANSGLNLTLYRAYDPDAGRWLNRDPMGEAGRINLYQYAYNSPANFVDDMGLWGIGVTGGAAVEVGKIWPSGGATGSVGAGFFANGLDVGNGDIGVFASGGAFFRGHLDEPATSAPKYDQSPGAVGLFAGVGGGGFITNAKKACDLNGPFKQWNVNLEVLGVNYANSDGFWSFLKGTWTLSVTVGPAFGGDVSAYPTTTVTASTTVSEIRKSAYIPVYDSSDWMQ